MKYARIEIVAIISIIAVLAIVWASKYTSYTGVNTAPPLLPSSDNNTEVDSDTYINWGEVYSTATSTSVSKVQGKTLSDKDIDNAIIAESNTDGVILKKKDANEFDLINGHGALNIFNIAKGDLNGDGFEDALVLGNRCSDSCDITLTVILNHNTTLESFNLNPYGIKNAGAGQATFKNASIRNGIIYITFNTDADSKDKTFAYVLSSTNGTARFYLERQKTDEETQADLSELFKRARAYVIKNSAIGDKFDLILSHYTSAYARFEVTPRDPGNDTAMLVMEFKINSNSNPDSNNGWQGVGVGTAFSDFFTALPEVKINDRYSYADYNFDGYIDRAENVGCGATGNCNYLIELYDPTTKYFNTQINESYISSDTVTQFDDRHFMPVNPVINSKEKIICSFVHGSASEFTFSIFGYKAKAHLFYPIKEIIVESSSTQNTINLVQTTYSFTGNNRKQTSISYIPEGTMSPIPQCSI